ncbi:MAG: hypothetical protein PWP65_604 [Clostridia bacterium]|nr:hypothetical protein [Clostridia bacterium]
MFKALAAKLGENPVLQWGWRALRRRGLYLAFLSIVCAASIYLITNDRVFNPGASIEVIPVESHAPASPVATPAEPPAGSETVPQDIQAQSGITPALSGEKPAPLLQLPLPGEVVAGFGFAYAASFGDYRFHPGIDVAAPSGSEIKAAAPGEVKEVEYSEDWRYRVLLDHGGGYQTVYANLADVRVVKGSKVVAGDVLGVLGEPGRMGFEREPHLHLELLRDRQPIDPGPHLH